MSGVKTIFGHSGPLLRHVRLRADLFLHHARRDRIRRPFRPLVPGHEPGPSDGDELTFETNRHFAMSLELVLEFPLGRFRPYLAAGGGLDRMEARGERLTTALGHEIIVEDPAESGLLDPVLQAGGGLRVFLFKGLGLNLDGRYVVVFDRPSSLQGLSFASAWPYDSSRRAREKPERRS